MGPSPIKIAILDMYDGTTNIGMKCIYNIVHDWSKAKEIEIVYDVFNIRGESNIPDYSYDIYISSGGPGSPLESMNENWDHAYVHWLTQIHKMGKPVFLICHSFQIACRHFELGTVNKRKSRQIGILPVHTLIKDALFDGLPETFFSFESRSYQIISPNDAQLIKMKAEIIALEKMRPAIPLERAIMAIKFSEKMYGVQFHPEADAAELVIYFNEPNNKENIINEFGVEKWERIMDYLDKASPIYNTYKNLIPNFLNKALVS